MHIRAARAVWGWSLRAAPGLAVASGALSVEVDIVSERAVPGASTRPERPAGRLARKLYTASGVPLPLSGALAFSVSLTPAPALYWF